MCEVGDNGSVSLEVPPTPGPTAGPTAQTTTQELKDGVAVVLSGDMDETQRFVFPVDSIVQSVRCSIGGGQGDADLYTKWDSPVLFRQPIDRNLDNIDEDVSSIDKENDDDPKLRPMLMSVVLLVCTLASWKR